MAHADYKSHAISAPGVFKDAMSWIWNGLIVLGENSARARYVRQINSMSDAELAERGLTRSDVVKRIMTDGYHV